MVWERVKIWHVCCHILLCHGSLKLKVEWCTKWFHPENNHVKCVKHNVENLLKSIVYILPTTEDNIFDVLHINLYRVVNISHELR